MDGWVVLTLGRDTNTPSSTSSLRIMLPRSRSGRIWDSRSSVVCRVLRVWRIVLISLMRLSLGNPWYNRNENKIIYIYNIKCIAIKTYPNT